MCSSSYDSKCKGYRATEKKIDETSDIHELDTIKMELGELSQMVDNKVNLIMRNNYCPPAPVESKSVKKVTNKKAVKKPVKKTTKRK